MCLIIIGYYLPHFQEQLANLRNEWTSSKIGGGIENYQNKSPEETKKVVKLTNHSLLR